MVNLTKYMKWLKWVEEQGIKEYSIIHEGIEYRFAFRGTYENFFKWFNNYVIKTFPECEICHRLILPFKSVCAFGEGLSHAHCPGAEIAAFSGFMDEDGKVRSEKNLGNY